MKSFFICPVCNFNKATNILNIDCGNFDNSSLYRYVRIKACDRCGHIYNELSTNEVNRLIRYYNQEYALTNISSPNKLLDRPGSNSIFSIKRYSKLYNLISPYINSNSRVLDVGCALGGFLDYLSSHGFNNLYGIDISKNYVNYAQKKYGDNIKIGKAESIPFNNKSMDVLVMDQVLEHLVEPRKAFREARRVLVKNGLLYISVPDASRYDKIYFFDFYWFLMREHIQHFDLEHLKLLAKEEGFKLITYLKFETPMMGEKMILPVLSAVFRLRVSNNKLDISKNCFRLKKEIRQYITNEFKRLNKKRRIINNLVISQKPLYVWGIGREFLYLYENAGLKNCNIVGLIDVNPYKQNQFTVDGKKIMDKSILQKAISNSALIITAIAHTKQIKSELSEIGYRGQIIEI